MSRELSRPLVRYHGGKWRIAPWIIEHLPPHRVYVEPFGGGGSVLLRKPRSYAEVYNDLDGEIVNLFRVARDHGPRLVDALRLTPFARDEFAQSYEVTSDPVEQARRTVIRSYMGFGSAAASGKVTSFRPNSNNSGTPPAADWAKYPDALAAIVDRLAGVVIENRDAIEVMAQQDAAHTVFYVDPPYVAETRDKGQDYRHEMTDADHRRLADALHGLVGMVVLSGYPSSLYDELYGHWRRVDRAALADGARARIESLWLNPAADSATVQQRLIA